MFSTYLSDFSSLSSKWLPLLFFSPAMTLAATGSSGFFLYLSVVIRKIIHIDMDAFFASVEQRDRPELKGKALVVGGSSDRGVVAAASYEARKYGIYSAMPMVKARVLCPHLNVVRPDFSKYKAVSTTIHEIFHDYTEVVEPLSIDEAFLDVSFPKQEVCSATLIAREIRKRIHEQTRLTASAGVSYNKFLAKVASDQNKPDGIFVIPPEEAIAFLEKLPIEKFFGVGKVATEKMHRLGIYNGKHLKSHTRQQLVQNFGKAGSYFYDIVRGVDNRPVEAGRKRKSIGAEQTFARNIVQKEDLLERLKRSIDKVWTEVEKKGVEGKTLSLKMKFSDFEIITRSTTLDAAFQTKDEFEQVALTLFEKEWPLPKALRLIGVSISNFRDPLAKKNYVQQGIWE